MIKMKSIKKGVLLYTFIVLCIIFTGLLAADYTITSLLKTANRGKIKGAIFERNGEICYFDYSKREIIVLDGGGKYSPVLSPDKTRILYRRSVLDTEGNTLQFGIIDINGKAVLDITIESELSNDIIDCQWLSDTVVGITTHINPSTSEFFSYDTVNGKAIGHFIGYSFTKIPNTEKIIYAKNIPHWSDEAAYHSFVVDEKILYTSGILDARLYPPVFSDDLTQIAFIECSPNPSNEEEKSRIIIGDFDYNNLVLTIISSIELPYGISGHLTFDSNNNICLINDNLLHLYDKGISSFKQMEIAADLPNNTGESMYLEELRNAVAEFWDDASPEEINNISWIH